jgi:hypothetical protein
MNTTLFRLVLWITVVASLALVGADLVSDLVSSNTSQDVQITPNDTDVILKRFNEHTVDIGLDTMKELARNERERFKDIDAKATTFIGMLSISLAVIASLGALGVNILDDKKPDADTKQAETSHGQKLVYSPYFRKRMIGLYALTLGLLLYSFFFAMLATRVPVGPSSDKISRDGESLKEDKDMFIGLEIPARHDISPKVVIGREYIGLEPHIYKKVLIGELAEVYAANVHTNNVKATRLSHSQLHAFVAGITLVGIAIIAIMAAIWGPPIHKPHICSATAFRTRKRESVLETKSA